MTIIIVISYSKNFTWFMNTEFDMETFRPPTSSCRTDLLILLISLIVMNIHALGVPHALSLSRHVNSCCNATTLQYTTVEYHSLTFLFVLRLFFFFFPWLWLLSGSSTFLFRPAMTLVLTLTTVDLPLSATCCSARLQSAWVSSIEYLSHRINWDQYQASL